MSDKQTINRFINYVISTGRVNQVAINKQNRIIEGLIKIITKMDDGFLTTEGTLKALDSIVPGRIYVSSKYKFDSESKAMCQRIFSDRMCRLRSRLEGLWLGEGSYPYPLLEIMMETSELVCNSIERVSVDSITKGRRARMDVIQAMWDILNRPKPFLIKKIQGTEYESHSDFINDILCYEHKLFMRELCCSWNDYETSSLPIAAASSGEKRGYLNRPRLSDNKPVKPIKCAQPAIQLCDPEEIERVIATNKKLNDVDKNSLEQLLASNGCASLEPVPSDFRKRLSKFKKRFPHMTPIADEILMNLGLATLSGTNKVPLQLFQSICILQGPPGLGKTVGLNYLAKELGVRQRLIGCAELTNGFDLSGMSSGWSSGKPGHVAKMLLEKRSPNCVIILDELDKMAGGESNFPPSQPLFTLLERETAKQFRDEFYDFEVNASHINWVGTSNYIENVPDPIKDRARIINVSSPNLEQRISIVSTIYEDILVENKNGWGHCFSSELCDEVPFIIASIPEISIRGMKQVIMRSLALIANQIHGRKIAPKNLKVRNDDVVEAVRILGLKGGSGSHGGIGFILN